MDNNNGSLPLAGTEESELMRKSTYESKQLVTLRGKGGKEELIIFTDIKGHDYLNNFK